MLNIIKYIIDIARVTVGTVYRAYPQKIIRGADYAVVTPQGYSVESTSSDHEVLSARLTYGVTIYATSAEKTDEYLEKLTDKLNKLGIQCTSTSPSFVADTGVYSVNAVYSCSIDKRGQIYR